MNKLKEYNFNKDEVIIENKRNFKGETYKKVYYENKKYFFGLFSQKGDKISEGIILHYSKSDTSYSKTIVKDGMRIKQEFWENGKKGKVISYNKKVELSSQNKTTPQTKKSTTLKPKEKVKNIESDDGENIMYYPNGKIKEKYIKVKGKIHGNSIKYDEDTGEVLSMFSYENGIIDGPYTVYTSKDIYTEGSWKDGKLVYNKIFKYGVLDEEFHYKDEKRHGKFKQYHSNGQIEQEGEFNDDEKHGSWKGYNDKGNLIQETYYSMGLKNGVSKTYFGNGEPDVESNYKNGIKNGVYKQFSESGSGKLECDGEFKDDNPCGVWKTYNEDGNIMDEKIYKDGEFISVEKGKNTTSNTQEKHDEITDDFLDFFIEKNQEKIKSWFPSLVDDNGNVIDEKEFKQVLKKKLEENGNL